MDLLTLHPGAERGSKLALKARGPQLALPALPLALPLRVQLSAEGGACWEARYEAAGVQHHDGVRFKARGE